MVLIHFPDGLSETAGPGTVEEILETLGLNPYEILVTRNGELLLAEDLVSGDDELSAVSIVHGG
jgi:sulfur carrier protein